jgi:Fic family protein
LALNRPAYMDGLKAAQQRLDYGPLVEVIARAVSATVHRAETAHSNLQDLSADWLARRKWRINSSSHRALALLMSNPVITAKSLSVSLGVSVQAANEAAKLLVEAKILKERKGHRRNRVFAAVEVLRIFGGATDLNRSNS